MKKSKSIILSSVFFIAISSCNNSHKDEWSDGKDPTGHVHDTAIYHQGHYYYYRYYGGGWYPLNRNNRINIGEMAPMATGEISNALFTPRAASGGIESGGFGSSAHGSTGAGE